MITEECFNQTNQAIDDLPEDEAQTLVEDVEILIANEIESGTGPRDIIKKLIKAIRDALKDSQT